MWNHNRMGAPEATPSGRRSRPARAYPILAIALLAGFFSIAIGDEKASLTVVNFTSHFVHIVVAGEPFLYIPPGSSATYETESTARVTARVFYAPGQGIDGDAVRSFLITPYRPASTSSTGCSSEWWGCTESTSVTRPASGGPTLWEVTADTLAAG